MMNWTHTQANFNQYSLQFTSKPNINSKTSKWRCIYILDSKTKEQIECYPLDNNTHLLYKMKRQKRRHLGKMTGRNGVPRNNYIATRKFKKLFPNDNITYQKKTYKSSQLSNNEEKTAQTQILKENDGNSQIYDLSLIATNQSPNISDQKDESSSFSTSSNDESIIDQQDNFDLSSIDWLLNTTLPANMLI
ncbi:hypothetical protein M9Y10_015862 [Tritrichomonas musculus]|uniref:Uncharacterized protein n=1 Tax=Tritrichomonas musculus TaxID=1915356 RepID=A0ABR2I5S3_9EUKA